MYISVQQKAYTIYIVHARMISCLWFDPFLQATANLLFGVLTAQLKSTFHKINVHAAMTPADIQNQFEPVFEQAKALKEAFERRAHDEQIASSQVSVCKYTYNLNYEVRTCIQSYCNPTM